MDSHDAAAPAGHLIDHPWVVATVGRLAGQGLLERPAESTDAVAAYLPGLSGRLDRPGAAFLDVGTGAAGIVIAMCRAHEALHAVGLDISAAAVTTAREQVAAAGLTKRAEIRDQSVAAIEDVDAFDLLWVRSCSCPSPSWPRRCRDCIARRGAGPDC